MRLKDKHTGKIKKVLKIVVEKENGYGEVFTSIKDLNEGYEDVPEDIKPFEEVAKVDYVVKLGYSRVDFVADGECVDTLKVADIDYYEILPDGTKKLSSLGTKLWRLKRKLTASGACRPSQNGLRFAPLSDEAWKRLKDAGFKFINWYGGSKTITYEFKDKPEGYISVEECADLGLLFGGEE